MDHKICFVLDTHYPNYTNRLKTTSLKNYIDWELNKMGIGFIITTNRPNDFIGYSDFGVNVFDIDELRSNNNGSIKYEILPEEPTGIYPSKFPWNLERFGLKKAAEMGYNIVINLDSDVIFRSEYDAKNLVTYLTKVFRENTVTTNQGIFEYKKGSSNEIFYLHDRYINYFDLKFNESDYNSLDGPVVIYMGKTSKDILRFAENWDMLTNFGYEKKYGFGYENIVCGNWSLCIPMSDFRLKWVDFPLTPNHKYEDRY